jgi:methionyl-tRNA formyltransferase
VRILFWGTPEFAAAPLRALIGEGFDVIGVVTQPDKPQGRSREVIPSPVKQIALEEGLHVFQPDSARDPAFIDVLRPIDPDISIVAAYGQILSRAIIDLPGRGTLNIHASLLPALRGAAPIQAAIRQGFTKSGVSIMRVVPALDAGPVILQAETPIHPDDTFGELRARLSELGALALIEALALTELGKAEEKPQDDAKATYAPKVNREATIIGWGATALEVSRTVRAYDPAPGALTRVNGKDLKLFGAKVSSSEAGTPGEILAVEPSLVVACASDAVIVTDVQPAGKNRMPAAAWTRGRGAKVGDVLGG